MSTQKERLLIVTEAALEHPDANPLSDADRERVNGVVRTYQNLRPHLEKMYDLQFLTPFDFPGDEQSPLKAILLGNTPFSMAPQKSVRLVLPTQVEMEYRMARIRPDHVHIATEGPLGIKAKAQCKREEIPFSTAFHTNWQQYLLEDGAKVPLIPPTLAAWTARKLMTAFHKSAQGTMAATEDLKQELVGWGLDPARIHIVSRGIDTDVFKPHPEDDKKDYVFCIGRVAPGKGVERFCTLDTGGLRKVVVGEGPSLAKIKAEFPNVEFAGFAQGEQLARYYSGARYFVMPSDTETFGMTVIESLACGTPVIALNRGGHQPILNDRHGLGVMRSELQQAFDNAIGYPEQFLDPETMATYIKATRSWEREAENFRTMVEASRQRKVSALGNNL